MSGSKTADLAQKVLDHVLGGATYTRPATVYIALSASAFDPAATGDSMDEISAGDYDRVAVTNNSTNWAAASTDVPSVKTNNNNITWPTATSDWGIPQAAYVCDAASGGNTMYGSDISNPQAVGSGDTPQILAGAFNFSED